MHWHSFWDENTTRPLFAQETNVARCIWFQRELSAKADKFHDLFESIFTIITKRKSETDRRERERIVCDKGCELDLTLHCCEYMIFTRATPRETVLTAWAGSQWSIQTISPESNKPKLHLKSDCMCFYAQEDISLWQELFWKSCFLTGVTCTYTCQRHCHSKHEGVEFNGNS